MSKWFSDVPISGPKPNDAKVLVSMQGFVFTENGIAHEITEEQYLEVFSPKVEPIDPVEAVYFDANLDTEFL